MATMKQQISTVPVKVLTLVILLLGLCVITKAKKFNEEDCRPRPTVVEVDSSHKYKPYHIILYRCSGTYNKISPKVKTCGVTEQHDLVVDAIDDSGTKTAIQVKNHTKCGPQCTMEKCANIDMIMEDCVCKCLTEDCDKEPPTGLRVVNTPDPKPDVKPYMVGMAVVGLFAVLVLIFDAALFIKKRDGFINTIKHSCCGGVPTKDKNRNQPGENQNMITRGDDSSTKHTVV